MENTNNNSENNAKIDKKCKISEIEVKQNKNSEITIESLNLDDFLSPDSQILMPIWEAKTRSVSPTYPELPLDLQEGFSFALKNIENDGFYEESMSMMNLVTPIEVSKLMDEDEIIKETEFKNYIRLGLLTLDSEYDDFEINYITSFLQEGLKMMKFTKK